MLALITERLQNQRLEDPVSLPAKSCSSNIELISAQGFQFTGTKPSGSSSDYHKKVWTLSYDGKKRSVNSRKQAAHESKVSAGGAYGSTVPPLLCCFHQKPVDSCAACSGSSLHTTPPKKKHCRSLSIPPDSATGSVSWQPQGSRLWKPIAVCPMVLHTKQHKNKPYSPNFGRCDLRTSVGNTTVSCVTPTRQDTGYFTSCDFTTPPESPIPRPASASSGYCEGSFSPIGAPWLDCSPYRSNKYESFKHRSLSLEDRISASTTAGSVPSVLSCINSTPSSPRRHRIPRCRSQPCVLHDRRCGIKRRRDYDYHRPALNFHKMAETAYLYKGTTSLTPLATPYEDYQVVNPFRPSCFREELQSAISLVPIASSPLDTEIPIKAIESPKNSPIKEIGRFSHIAMSEDSGCSEVDEGEEPPSNSCPCQDEVQREDNPDIFHIADLDLEEIESH